MATIIVTLAYSFRRVGSGLIHYVRAIDRFLAVAAGILAVVGSLCANTIVVDKNGQGSFTTIQAGINAAAVHDTVYVMAGRYYEHLTISKKLILRGVERDSSIVDGGNNGLALTVSSDSVMVTDLALKHGNPAAIRFSSVNYCTLQGLLIDSNLAVNGGVLMNHSSYNLVTQCIISNNYDGINNGDSNCLYNVYDHLEVFNNVHMGIVGWAGSNNCQVKNNLVYNNDIGILWAWSSGTVIENNVVHNSSNSAIFLETNSSNCIVRNNEIYNNVNGFASSGGGASGHTIEKNRMYLNRYAISASNNFHTNTIRENLVYTNECGLRIWESGNYPTYDNSYYHNVFQDNDTPFVVTTVSPRSSTFDNGYPSGGNFWSDYTGNDVLSGSNQNQPGSDGIGDVGYVLQSPNNIDHYPLMQNMDATRPSLLCPSDNADDQPSPLIMKWSTVAGAASYHLQVSEHSDFGSLVENDSGLTDTTKIVTGIIPNTHYYWRVRAKVFNVLTGEASTTTAFSDTWVFSGQDTHGLVLYLPMEGNAHDRSGYSNNGTVSGATPAKDRFGISNHAYLFNGNAFIAVPSSQALSRPFSELTLSAWIRMDPAADLHGGLADGFHIITKGAVPAQYHADYSMQIDTIGDGSHAGFLTFEGKNSPVHGQEQYCRSQHSVMKGVWHHLVIRYGQSKIQFYIDAALDQERDIDLPFLGGSDEPLYIGMRYPTNNMGGFKGGIDDIRIYNRALSALEIDSLYHENGWEGDTITWKMQIAASAGPAVTNSIFLGIAPSADSLFDPAFDMPAPPVPAGEYVQPLFPHPEDPSSLGNNYSQDIRTERSLADNVICWRFDVKTNQINTNVVLNFVPDENVPPCLGVMLKDLTLGTRKNLKNDGMSYTYNSGMEEIRHFEIMVGDSTKPALTLIKPNGGEIIRANHTYNVTWRTSDGTGIDSIFVFRSINAGTTYELLAAISGLDSSYAWSVPPMYLNYGGMIKVMVRDSVGNTSVESSGHTFTTVGDSLAASFIAGWTLIGTPLKPADSTVIKILADDISEKFYLYEYDPSIGYSQPVSLRQGRGYWLGISYDVSPIDVVGAAVTDQNTVPLTPGFNIISNPLVVPVPKDSLKFRKDGNTITYAEAIMNRWIATGIQDYDRTLNNYQSVDTLKIFKGYWLGVIETGVEMIVTPPGYNQLPALSRKPLAGQTANGNAEDWIVNIRTSAANSTDPSLRFGQSRNATDGYDSRYDEPKAPAPPTVNYVEAYFIHQDWIPILGSKFSSDIRSSGSAQSWVFYVGSAENTPVTLTWDAGTAPGGIELVDNANGTVVNLANTNSYTFTSEGLRSFTINEGTTDIRNERVIPTAFALEQNFPNPFNPATVIGFSLPRASTVRLKIFNLLGEEIETIVDKNLPAGRFTVAWDASGLPSGVYFYKIQAGQYSQSRKMVLTK